MCFGISRSEPLISRSQLIKVCASLEQLEDLKINQVALRTRVWALEAKRNGKEIDPWQFGVFIRKTLAMMQKEEKNIEKGWETTLLRIENAVWPKCKK